MGRNETRITVLLSVYNGERYLREAIESVLRQTFSEFEFIVIDDGSTDRTPEIVASYGDKRIRFISNDRRLGLAASLNKGVALAGGEYIARMDSDDVSLPDRLERQKRFLDSHPEVDALFSLITLMDGDGRYAGVWKEDSETLTREEIRRTIPAKNCLAHPASMIRKSVLARFRYDEKLTSMQDYNLWLRMSSARVTFDKLKTPLVRYRLHGSSVTASSSRVSLIGRVIRLKANFLLHQALRFRLGVFELSVFRFLCGDLLEFARLKTGARVAASTRDLLAGIGRMFAPFVALRNKSRIFFFFSPAAVAGSQRVHADIASCFADAAPHLFLVEKSEDEAFPRDRTKGIRIHDISRFAGSKAATHLATGLVAGLIKRHGRSVLLGSKSEFFEKLLPRLPDEARAIEVLHSCAGQEEMSSLLSYAERIDCRVLTDESLRTLLSKAYGGHEPAENCRGWMEVIPDAVHGSETLAEKGTGAMRVLYVGRGAPEERIYLLGGVATAVRKAVPSCEFWFVGKGLDRYIDAENLPDCICMGAVPEELGMRETYARAHVVISASRSVGFPVVLMEAMAHGIVPVCTDAGGISSRVKNGLNGFLVTSEEEGEIVEEMASKIRYLLSNRPVYAEMSRSAYAAARENFGWERFENAYRKLVLGRLQ